VAARGVLDEVARDAPPPGAPPVYVFSQDAAPAWEPYARLGLLPRGLPDAGRDAYGVERSGVGFVVHELHFARDELLLWQSYGTARPSYVLRLDGVPLVSVYRRPPPTPTAPPAPAQPPPPPAPPPAAQHPPPQLQPPPQPPAPTR
jgi:hypothetical protein